MEDIDISLIRLACLAERAVILSLTGWPEINQLSCQLVSPLCYINLCFMLVKLFKCTVFLFIIQI